MDTVEIADRERDRHVGDGRKTAKNLHLGSLSMQNREF
jgi:hypothetical protein